MTRIVYISDYTPFSNGVDSDFPALLAAVTACGNDGTVVLEGGKKYWLMENTLQLPAGVRIENPGVIGGSGVYDQSWFDKLGGLIITPGYQIIMHSRSALKNLVIAPKGMTFPQANSSSWTGTPLTTRTGVNEVDVRLEDVLVLGFALAFDGVNCPRLRMTRFEFDCLAGIVVDNAGDSIQLEYCRGWPWATVSGPNGNAGLVRPGVAFELKNNTDAGTLRECFSGHYATGYKISNLDGLRLIGCGAESLYIPSAIGYLIEGAAQHVELIGCQGNGLQNAVVQNTSNIGYLNSINGGLFGQTTDNAVRVFGGTLAVRNAHLYATDGACTTLIGPSSRLILQNNIYPSNGVLNQLFGANPAQLISTNNVIT